MQCDVGDSAQVADFFSQIQITYPHIDLLINNAGISYVGLLQDMSDDEWTAIVNSNLSSVFYNCRAVIPTMLAQQYGKIINITSVWGEIGASTEVAYSATKGGVCAFTKALAKELGPSHITVNAVSCGFIDSFPTTSAALCLRKSLSADRLLPKKPLTLLYKSLKAEST